MINIRTAIILIVFLFSTACESNVAKHNYYNAADTAKSFIENLLIHKNYTVAYQMLHEDFRAQIKQNQFEETTNKVHQGNFPNIYEITEYEIYSGQEYFSVFVQTKEHSPAFYYRIALKGSSSEGYSVVGFHVAAEPIPSKGNRLTYEPKILIKGA